MERNIDNLGGVFNKNCCKTNEKWYSLTSYLRKKNGKNKRMFYEWPVWFGDSINVWVLSEKKKRRVDFFYIYSSENVLKIYLS